MYCSECVDPCASKQQDPEMTWVSQTMVNGVPVDHNSYNFNLCGEYTVGLDITYIHTWACMSGTERCKQAIEQDTKTPNKHTTVSPKEKDSFHKVPVHLFPSTAIVAGSMVIAQGHKKPGRTIFNWRNEKEAIKYTGYVSAVMRHLYKILDGEDIDEELTELAGVEIPHLWAALSGLAILIDAQESGTCVDDRNKKGAVAEMMKRLTPALPINQK